MAQPRSTFKPSRKKRNFNDEASPTITVNPSFEGSYALLDHSPAPRSGSAEHPSVSKGNAAAVVIVIVVVIFLLVLSVFILLKISELKSGALSCKLHTPTTSTPTGLEQNFESLSESIEMLKSSVTALNQLIRNSSLTYDEKYLAKQLNSSIAGLIPQLFQDLEFQMEPMLSLHDLIMQIFGSGQFPTFPISCAALPPSSPSGYYWVTSFYGSAVRVYCDMTRSCGGVAGGWTRVLELDTTNSSQQCPSGLRQRNDSNLRTCIRNLDAAGCSQVILPTSRLQYSRVCGRIKAYQVGSPDTFGRHGSILDIDDNYVDGVSLTHGNPRQHIWTFAAGHDENGTRPHGNCPCANNGTAIPPLAVADDYFCDTGSSDMFQNGFFYSSDPLWDGAGCGPLNTCCSFNTPPWFYKQLPRPTTDDIEVRVCRDQNLSDEDIALEKIDIYIQ